MDGEREHHDFSVCREGGYDAAFDGMREALRRGFRVTTNTTLFDGADPVSVRRFFPVPKGTTALRQPSSGPSISTAGTRSRNSRATAAGPATRANTVIGSMLIGRCLRPHHSTNRPSPAACAAAYTFAATATSSIAMPSDLLAGSATPALAPLT